MSRRNEVRSGKYETVWAQSNVDLLNHFYCGSDKTVSLGCTLIAYALSDHRYCKNSTGRVSVLKVSNYYPMQRSGSQDGVHKSKSFELIQFLSCRAVQLACVRV